MEHTIGIDFGTTKTLVSYYDSKNKTPCYVRLGRGIDKMPTTIYVDEDGVWQFGDEADDNMCQSPTRYKRDFKLDLGKNAPVLGAKVNGRIRQYTAKDLTAKFLKHIKDQCEEMVFHETVTSCTVTHPVVTHPEAFSIAQCEELKAAAQEAGFEHVRLLPEPEAAGYAYYAFGADKHLSKLMVVDWGGGTVDFAMVQFDGNEVHLISNSYGGEKNVGGRKFDELLFDHLSNKIRKNDGACLDGSDLKLQQDICRYKEKLSMVTAVKQVVLVGSNSQKYRTEVGRDEFNTIITPVVDRVVNQLKGLLDKCAEKPEALLLIGGSSSVPFVRERLEEETGLKCVNWDKRNEAVAIGAAWYGSTSDDFLFQNLPSKCVLVGANTGKTIHAEDYADGQLVANLNDGDGKSGLFTLIKNADGTFSLQSEMNGKFVSAIPPSHGDCRLVVNGPTIDAWEKFELTKVSNTFDEFTLRSLITGKYVSVNEDSGNRLFANRNAADAWEKIRVVFSAEQGLNLPGKCVLVGVNTGMTVCAENGGWSPLVANRQNSQGAWEEFTLFQNNDGSYSLKSHANGLYVSAQPDGRLLAAGVKVDGWELFDVKKVPGKSDVFTLWSRNTRKYVSVDEMEGNMLIANRDNADTWEEFRIVRL